MFLNRCHILFFFSHQYEVDESALSSHTLWFTVWDWDKFGEHSFLGEVSVPLSGAKLDGTRCSYTLHDNVDVVSSMYYHVIGFPLCFFSVLFYLSATTCMKENDQSYGCSS